jgi:hypothetical protein
MLAWGIITSNYKKKTIKIHSSRSENKKWAHLSLNLAPHNYFLNKQIKASENYPGRSALPMINIRLKL